MWTSPTNMIAPCLFCWVNKLDPSDEYLIARIPSRPLINIPVSLGLIMTSSFQQEAPCPQQRLECSIQRKLPDKLNKMAIGVPGFFMIRKVPVETKQTKIYQQVYH